VKFSLSFLEKVATETVSAVAGDHCSVCCGRVLIWHRTEVVWEKWTCAFSWRRRRRGWRWLWRSRRGWWLW